MEPIRISGENRNPLADGIDIKTDTLKQDLLRWEGLNWVKNWGTVSELSEKLKSGNLTWSDEQEIKDLIFNSNTAKDLESQERLNEAMSVLLQNRTQVEQIASGFQKWKSGFEKWDVGNNATSEIN